MRRFNRWRQRDRNKFFPPLSLAAFKWFCIWLWSVSLPVAPGATWTLQRLHRQDATSTLAIAGRFVVSQAWEDSRRHLVSAPLCVCAARNRMSTARALQTNLQQTTGVNETGCLRGPTVPSTVELGDTRWVFAGFLLVHDESAHSLEDEGTDTTDWPPRSPGLNPTEHLCDVMFRAHTSHSQDLLQQHFSNLGLAFKCLGVCSSLNPL